MDTELEKQIARTLIRRELSQRFLYEVAQPGAGIIHKLPRMVEDRLVVHRGEQFSRPADIAERMRAEGVGNMCYVLSEFSDFHRVYVPLRTALEAMQFTNFPALIVGLPSGFAYLKGTAYARAEHSWFIRPFRGFDRVP